MKKLIPIFLLSLFCFCVSTNAQKLEPEFIGEVNLVSKDSTATILDKENVQISTKAGASLYIVGIGSVKSRITINSPRAKVRASSTEPVTLIVRAVDNNSDPLSVVSLFKFDIKGKKRRAELSKSNTFGGNTEGNLKYIRYKAKKYGKSSYLLTCQKLESGEYGIMVNNPNDKDEKNIIVACFGVD